MFDRLNGIAVNGYQIEAEAGANLIATTKVARFQSLTGFEFAAGIPGSIGGAVFMNAGAYGGEIDSSLGFPKPNVDFCDDFEPSYSTRPDLNDQYQMLLSRHGIPYFEKSVSRTGRNHRWYQASEPGCRCRSVATHYSSFAEFH